jgi:hypothetical protein
MLSGRSAFPNWQIFFLVALSLSLGTKRRARTYERPKVTVALQDRLNREDAEKGKKRDTFATVER